MPVLETQGLLKHYGDRTILQRITLRVEAGERLALLGPSGCGKTTLLNLLGGLDRPDSGSILLDGEDISRADSQRIAQLRRAKIGTVFQFFHLIPHLTVLENVQLPLQLLNWKPQDALKRAEDLILSVGLMERINAWPQELSNGEMQRVAVARALAARPRLLLADEPTGNLDRKNGEAVLQLLKDLTERERTALVLVTHSEAATRTCHRVLRLEDGYLVDEGFSLPARGAKA
jgi:putative ABC transport system ATP-binding protein